MQYLHMLLKQALKGSPLSTWHAPGALTADYVKKSHHLHHPSPHSAGFDVITLGDQAASMQPPSNNLQGKTVQRDTRITLDPDIVVWRRISNLPVVLGSFAYTTSTSGVHSSSSLTGSSTTSWQPCTKQQVEPYHTATGPADYQVRRALIDDNTFQSEAPQVCLGCHLCIVRSTVLMKISSSLRAVYKHKASPRLQT